MLSIITKWLDILNTFTSTISLTSTIIQYLCTKVIASYPKPFSKYILQIPPPNIPSKYLSQIPSPNTSSKYLLPKS